MAERSTLIRPNRPRTACSGLTASRRATGSSGARLSRPTSPGTWSRGCLTSGVETGTDSTTAVAAVTAPGVHHPRMSAEQIHAQATMTPRWILSLEGETLGSFMRMGVNTGLRMRRITTSSSLS